DAGKSIYESIISDIAGDEAQEELETALSTVVKQSEVAEKLNDIERLVIEYETACELAQESFKATQAKQSFYSYIDEVNKRKGVVSGEFMHVTAFDKRYRADDLNEELARLRRGYWSLVLDTDEFKKMLTNDAIQKLNRQLTVAQSLELNYVNIRMLLTAIYANKDDMLVDSIVSIFKKITRYHMNEYSTNIHYYDGWKTNDAYRINKKVIIPISSAFDGWDLRDEYERLPYEVKNWIDDMVRAFQIIDEDAGGDFEYIGNNSFENELLRFRMFLNGNIHVWFNDLKLLDKLNYLCGQHFNWIPSEGEQAADEEARRWVAKEFGDIGEVKLLMA